MPNRLLRDGLLDSDAIGSISPGAEMLFVRLMLLADDFGRYDGRVSVICRRAFVNRRAVDEHMTGEWLQELHDAGLLELYHVGSAPYIELHKFRQRTRAMRSKFPDKNGQFEVNQALTTKNDRHPPDGCPSDDRPPRTETETETETKKDPLTPLQGAPACPPGVPHGAAGDDEGDAAPGQAPHDAQQVHRQGKAPPIGIKAWLKACADAGVKPIPQGGPALAYAQQARIPDDFVLLHWREFKVRMAESGKRYRDWPQAFLNSLRGNWYGLWNLHADGACGLSTKGVQAKRVQEAMQDATPATVPGAVPTTMPPTGPAA